MIDHVSVAVRDIAAATRFYDVLLATIGVIRLETRPATVGFGKKYPEFWINLRAETITVSGGSHI
ncbi:MAG: VOC family protein, partial [Pseudolabrys sp.]